MTDSLTFNGDPIFFDEPADVIQGPVLLWFDVREVDATFLAFLVQQMGQAAVMRMWRRAEMRDLLSCLGDREEALRDPNHRPGSE